MDIRHPLTPFDRQLLLWSRRRDRLDLLLLLTKADKLKRGAARAQLQAVQRELREAAGHLRVALFSAHAREGIETVHAWLDERLGVSAGLEGSPPMTAHPPE
jgi:GTP-binding protein